MDGVWMRRWRVFPIRMEAEEHCYNAKHSHLLGPHADEHELGS